LLEHFSAQRSELPSLKECPRARLRAAPSTR
jgi:WD40 repeat protein